MPFEMNQCNNIFKTGLVSNCNFFKYKTGKKSAKSLAHAYNTFRGHIH